MNQKSLTVGNQDKLQTLRGLLQKSKNSIQEVLPAHMSADRMVKIATVAASRNPLLLQCDTISILRALMESSQLGLEPFTGLQQAYIIPYRNGKTGHYEAQFMPSYRGLIDLARRSGEIRSIEAHVVYENDLFECELGLNPKLKHVPSFDGKNRGEPRLAYAVAMLKDGASQYEVMTKAEIEEVRSASKSANNGPWVNWWSEMAKKTVLKRLVKYLPMSAELSKAVTKDNAAENDEVFDVDSIELPELDQPAVAESKADDLTRKLENMSSKE